MPRSSRTTCRITTTSTPSTATLSPAWPATRVDSGAVSAGGQVQSKSLVHLGDPASDSTDVLLRRREAGCVGCELILYSVFSLNTLRPTPCPSPNLTTHTSPPHVSFNPSVYRSLFCFKIFIWLHQALVASCTIISCGRQDLFLSAACGI